MDAAAYSWFIVGSDSQEIKASHTVKIAVFSPPPSVQWLELWGLWLGRSAKCFVLRINHFLPWLTKDAHSRLHLSVRTGIDSICIQSHFRYLKFTFLCSLQQCGACSGFGFPLLVMSFVGIWISHKTCRSERVWVLWANGPWPYIPTSYVRQDSLLSNVWSM